MRTTLLGLTLCLTFASASLGAQNAQSVTPTPFKSDVDKYPTLDIYGTVPLQHCGWGMGFGVFGKSQYLGNLNPYTPLLVRFGGEFYLQEMAHRAMGNMPLSAPQIGDAKVRLSTNNLGFNFVSRFSTPYSRKFTPYVDAYLGIRDFWTGMSITPLQQQPGYENATSQNLASSWQFTYGLSAGVMYSLGKYVKFNTGIMYGTSNKIGQIIDLKKVTVDNGSLVTQNMVTPKDMFTFKFGFTFIMDNSNSYRRNNYNYNSRRTSTRVGGTWGGSSGGTRSNHININTRPSK